MNRIRTILMTLALALFLPAADLLACATCRPNGDDPIAHAADMSVIFLGVLVVGIIGMFLSFFGYLNYRSRHPLVDPAQLIAEAGPGDIGPDHEVLPSRA